MIIKNFKSLALNKERKIALEIAEAGLEALNYEKIDFEKYLYQHESTRILTRNNTNKNIYLLGFGKGSSKIADILRKKIKFKEIYVIDVKGRYFKGTHPLPSRKNFLFTKKIIKRFQGKLTKDDLVIVLVCGGGSAMLIYPKIDLKKYIQVNQELLKSGANIYEMNTIRKHLDLVKGGGLLKILYPAKVISFIFSDVPGNDLSFIASGPTVKDKTKIADALKIIKKYKLRNIKKEDLIETPKGEKYFKNVKNILALSNLTALKAMKEKAESLGLKAKILTDNLKGDVKDVAKFLFQEIKKSKEKILIAGGETTVKVKGKGKGGRNQELVLWFLKYILPELNDRINYPNNIYPNNRPNNIPGYKPNENQKFGPDSGNKFGIDSGSDIKFGNNSGKVFGQHSGNNFIIISLNSDGWDNTEFAGAIGDKMTLEKAKKLKLDIDKFLENNDSFHFFKKTKDGIITGRLPVNVADLILVCKF
jgi:glycerate 2-kinase